MSEPAESSRVEENLLGLLRAPGGTEPLRLEGQALIGAETGTGFQITKEGIPLLAGAQSSEDARRQEAHYDKIARAYSANLEYPHTQEYMQYLDDAVLQVLGTRTLDTTAEICCGLGEAFSLIGARVSRGIGVDISVGMLERARERHHQRHLLFVQGDATRLPLASRAFDAVFMLGGVHHVNDRAALFSEVSRILKDGGTFFFREPLNDFWLWRSVRKVIYRVAPALDPETERPLRREETVPLLEASGLRCVSWRGYGFVGFCLFMNSDVLVFNRAFRFVPGIRRLARWSTRMDALTLRSPGLGNAGLQVVGAAEKAYT